ncbi:hypothetical protein GCM10027341_17310 [Spirosoma knui]
MTKPLYSTIVGLLMLGTISASGQRHELGLSPVGFFYPKNQAIQYERYLGSWQSLTASLSHNSSQRSFSVFDPPRTDHFSATRLAIGYRRYFDLIDGYEGILFFGSVRAVVDYSALQLQSIPKYGIPADSLRAAGFSLAPEFLLGGKITIAKRVTLTGAAGMQHLFKLFSTRQITNNVQYWSDEYWTNDNQSWGYKRNVATSFRQGWYPSITVTINVILNKKEQVPMVY